MNAKYFTFYAEINDLSARFLMRDVNNAIQDGATEIHISMASNGGLNRAGFVIYNFLCGVNAKIFTHNLGHVDSAALCMFLAGTTRSASPISSFNIHRPTNNLPKESTYSKNLLFEYAKLLEYDEKNMIAIYTERTLMSETDARQFMEQGTVLTPSEAVNIGVISVIEMFGPPFGEAVQTIGM